MNESGPIIEYLLDPYGEGRLSPPRESPQWAIYLQRMFYAEGRSIFFAQQLGLLSDYANVRSWLARIRERPALHRALS